MLEPWLVKLVIAVVVLVWAGLTVASTFNKSIEVPPALTGVFMSIVGGVVATSKTSTGGTGKDEDA